MAVFLNACAHRPAPSAEAAGTSVPPKAPGVEPGPPTVPARDARKPAPRTTAPQPPSRAEQIIALVREGRLVTDSDGALVFVKSGLTRPSRSGLYYDAILLTRLRRALKDTKGIPESLSANATVRDAKAFITIDDTLPLWTAASAIDASLRTPGIIAVQAQMGR